MSKLSVVAICSRGTLWGRPKNPQTEPADARFATYDAFGGPGKRPVRIACLEPGDRMKVIIEKIGTLENTVVAAKNPESARSWCQEPPKPEHDRIFG